MSITRISIPSLVLAAATIVACGPKPRVPFDPSNVPTGAGWSCFPVQDPGGPERGACYRTEAECVLEKDKSGSPRDRCTAVASAHCLHIEGDARLHCYTNVAGCNEFRRNYEAAYSISECTTVP